jgi:hypothetical protein
VSSRGTGSILVAAVAAALLLVCACGSSHGPASGAASGDASTDAGTPPDAAVDSVATDAPAADAATSDAGADADGAADAAFQPAAHRSFPALAKNSGRVLQPLKLVTIVASNDSLAAPLFAFSDALAASSWLPAVGAAYGVTTATSAHATGPAITTNPTQADMIAYIGALVTAGTAPAPDGNTCYLLYLPDGVSVATGGSTPPFAAYHAPYPAEGQGLGDGWAVVSRTTPYGGGETKLGALTRLSSHEVLEAASDPGWDSWSLAAPGAPVWQGSVWSVFQVPGPIESGDLCEGTRWFEPDGGSEYQRVLAPSPPANGDPCVPAPAGAYFDVSAPADWYALGADGGTTSIPLTGWSSAPASDWLVIATVGQATAGFSSLAGSLLAVDSPKAGISPCLGAGMNDDVTATMSVAAPPGAASGDWAVVVVESFRVDPSTCYPYATGDQFHMWLTGVYVQ